MAEINENDFFNQNIFEIQTNKSFLKIKRDSMGIDKIKCSFVNYNKQAEEGKKVTNSIDIYLSVEDALVLASDILSGKIIKSIEKNKDDKYFVAYSSSLGGIKEEACEKRGIREDGKALSRVMTIIPSTLKNSVCFMAKSGPGETNERGLIVPKYQKPEKQVMVACSYEALKKMALKINVEINAYYAAQYTLELSRATKAARNK